jgi:predicted nucleotide-binding protein (sugar kinase/HSP70/actin superfamily)
VVPGSADQTYRRALDRLIQGVERERARGALRAVEWAAKEFAALPVDRSAPRPVVAILGEVYVLLNPYMNNDLVRAVEAAGGEVLIGTFLDVLDMTETNNSRRRWRQERFADFLGADISRRYQRLVLRRMYRPFAKLLRHPLEGPLREVYKLLDPYFDTDLGGEGVLTLARALELSRHGIGAVINVLPFSCMAGLVAVAMAPTVRPAMEGVPWLDISFDAQESTNIRTRLEALMHQARQFDRRRGEASLAATTT